MDKEIQQHLINIVSLLNESTSIGDYHKVYTKSNTMLINQNVENIAKKLTKLDSKPEEKNDKNND